MEGKTDNLTKFTIVLLLFSFKQALNEKDRKKYVDLAAKDQERYKEEMANYTPADGDDSKKRKRGKKDPNAPKRGMSVLRLHDVLKGLLN